MQGIGKEHPRARQKTCKARLKSYRENMQELERQHERVIEKTWKS
jgi:hypothetical protein